MNHPLAPQAVRNIVQQSIDVKSALLATCTDAIYRCGVELSNAALQEHNILLCGNGGSAADSQHIAAELVVRLRGNVERRAIAAMALTVDSSILTAGGNDYGFERVFARQVEAFGQAGGVLIAISTSGTSANVVAAVQEAHKRGMRTIGLLGGAGGTLAELCHDSVIVPSAVTARIQECHILVGHIWCEMVEEAVVAADTR